MSYLGINIGGTTCSVSRGTGAGEILEREAGQFGATGHCGHEAQGREFGREGE